MEYMFFFVSAPHSVVVTIGVGAHSTLGAHNFCPKNVLKISKMPEFYIIIARKIFFPNFRGHVSPLSPSPMPVVVTW